MLTNPPSIFDILQKHLLEGASFSATQGIDYEKNVFTLNVQQIQPSNITITKSDIVRLGLLPSGSKWRQGLGWYSIFGIPFKLQNKNWLAIGAEMIIKHERNDTTHPVFQAYIFEFTQAQSSSIINGLQNVALEIYPNSKKIRRSKTGIVYSNFQSPQKYKVVESFIIQSAIAVYREKQTLLFRTVILSDEQLKKVEYPTPTFLGDKSGYLMGTTSHIQSAFSWQARLKLFMCRAYSFQ